MEREDAVDEALTHSIGVRTRRRRVRPRRPFTTTWTLRRGRDAEPVARATRSAHARIMVSPSMRYGCSVVSATEESTINPLTSVNATTTNADAVPSFSCDAST